MISSSRFQTPLRLAPIVQSPDAMRVDTGLNLTPRVARQGNIRHVVPRAPRGPVHQDEVVRRIDFSQDAPSDDEDPMDVD
jgi:hypothetical protein